MRRAAVAIILALSLTAFAVPAVGADRAAPAGTEELVQRLLHDPSSSVRALGSVILQEPTPGLPPEVIFCGLFVLAQILIGVIPIDFNQILGQFLLCLLFIPRAATQPVRGEVPGGWAFFRQVRGPSLVP